MLSNLLVGKPELAEAALEVVSEGGVDDELGEAILAQLSPDERGALARLGVFAGGFSEADAAAVGVARERLTGLERRGRVEPIGGDRHRVHPMLVGLARRELDQLPARDQVRRAHAQRETERATRPDAIGPSFALPFQRGMLAHERGEHDEARREYEAALAVAVGRDDRFAIGLVCLALGELEIGLERGDLDKAEQWLERARSGLAEAGDDERLALALRGLADVAERRRDVEQAAHLRAQAATIWAVEDG
jgi:tetratricopeptide (TPR) repeat protein